MNKETKYKIEDFYNNTKCNCRRCRISEGRY